VALADFVAPRPSGLRDYIGAFMVTAGIGEDEIADRFKAANDDYSFDHGQALADRLAEAFAERLHSACARSSGPMPPMRPQQCDRSPKNIAASVRRPAIRRSPSTQRGDAVRSARRPRAAWRQAHESFAMWPGASVVRALTSATPRATILVGRSSAIGRGLRKRKGWTGRRSRRNGRPILNYDPLRSGAHGGG